MTGPDLTTMSRRQRGVGLIEVMIGLTAGLVLLGVLAYFLLGGRQVNRTQDDLSRMQESGRTALEIMGRTIRQAGAFSSTSAEVVLPGLIHPVFANALAGTEGASGAPDTLTVRYGVQDGGEADCIGTAVATGTVTYVFAVDTATNTLTCDNGTGAPVVVMDNIEDMQITYGVDTNGDGAIDAYQSWTGVNPVQVTAVRVSLMVRGPTLGSATGNQTFTYNGASVSKSDRFLRQVYTSTFALRTQAE